MPFIFRVIIVFVATRISGDPVQLMTAMNPHITEEARNNLISYYGLDKPVWQQFFIYLTNLLRGDLGTSFVVRGGVEVTTLIGDYIWPTMLLQIVSIIFALLIAIPVGIISARKRFPGLI